MINWFYNYIEANYIILYINLILIYNLSIFSTIYYIKTIKTILVL